MVLEPTDSFISRIPQNLRGGSLAPSRGKGNYDSLTSAGSSEDHRSSMQLPNASVSLRIAILGGKFLLVFTGKPEVTFLCIIRHSLRPMEISGGLGLQLDSDGGKVKTAGFNIHNFLYP